MSFLSIPINEKSLSFIKNNFVAQIQALEQFYPIIKSALNLGLNPSSVKFGGGTALSMYYFQHRLSFDIDLFVNDAQYLGFFSPKLWIDDCAHFDSARYIDQHNHIGVTNRDNIKIDILIDYASNEGYIDDSKKIFAFDIYIESLENIIAKKITFRKTDNKTRDIFDIAVALHNDSNLFDKLLNAQKISKQDLLTLQNSLQELNKEKYNSQIKIVKPTQEYSHIALNAYEILTEKIDQIKTTTHNTDNLDNSNEYTPTPKRRR
ncbi:nucleotidyl transferase AbiEii/AbiGii toxin family protein [Helicobacter pylori]|uniref:nucleotidyl transferase AbiEii/AbiGii toxin family protein n=1 Tax=Helicobacter pylori TaxID=210 RepID=UPI00205208BB|nr:nucleotidyl transferase AbiEii/AbiGii toxin family protein [Helicobacter pylori]BCI99850.1 serine/threonine-protein kinase CtkA [Helicobacter pylori]